MCRSITISKSILSKLALLQACAQSHTCCSIEDTDTHWVLSYAGYEDATNLEELYHLCLEKETQLAMEATVAPLRELLYRKAFEPVAMRE
jgi:hypothetical protein